MMTFKSALIKLKRIAKLRNETYYSARFELTETGDSTKTECLLYINGLPCIYSGPTWEQAFKAMDNHLNPPPVMTTSEIEKIMPQQEVKAEGKE